MKHLGEQQVEQGFLDPSTAFCTGNESLPKRPALLPSSSWDSSHFNLVDWSKSYVQSVDPEKLFTDRVSPSAESQLVINREENKSDALIPELIISDEKVTAVTA